MDILIYLFYISHNHYVITAISITIIIISLCISVLAVKADLKVKLMNKDLLYREELFHTLGLNIEEVFIVYDAGLEKFEYISPNINKSLGITPDNLKNNIQRYFEYIPQKERYQILEILNSTLNESRQIEFELETGSPERKRWLCVCIFPAYSNELLRYIICIEDITREKEDKKLLKEALEDTRKANEAKKEFLSHMSHEIRTPINSIIGMTQIALYALDDKEKVSHCLSKITCASDRLLEMINNILDMSKLDSHKLVLNEEPFSICELLTEISSITANQADLQKKEFALIIKNSKEYNVLGDNMRLYQVLMNCISNALKFTPQGGKISLEVSDTGVSDDIVNMHFVITDTGIGMCKEFLARLFSPFDQEEGNTSKIYGGTGLGMTIVKSLVMLMGGNISVTSEKNIGTAVNIELPFKVSQLPKQQSCKAIKDYKKYDCSGRRVIVVEDNEINSEITCAFLKYSNIDYDAAPNGREAIRLFEVSSPGYYDAVLMDIRMPDFDGYDTTAAIRNSTHPDAKEICIIAMTADNCAEESRSLNSGMDYHITKPIDIDYFNALMHNIISRKKSDHIIRRPYHEWRI